MATARHRKKTQYGRYKYIRTKDKEIKGKKTFGRQEGESFLEVKCNIGNKKSAKNLGVKGKKGGVGNTN